MHYTMTGALARRVAERLHRHMIDQGHVAYGCVILAMEREGIASPQREVRLLIAALFDQPSQTDHYRWIGQQIATACADRCAQREQERDALVAALYPFVEEIVGGAGGLVDARVKDLKREDS